VRRLIEPRRIGVIGVSATSRNFGRIILDNIIARGFDPADAVIIKPGLDRVDTDRGAVSCVPSIADLAEPIDLLVVATGADQLPTLVTQCIESGKVASAILIPGGAGETHASDEIAAGVRRAIDEGRARDPNATVFIGPNCLGVQSRPGRYDTFFIPESKLPKPPASALGSGVALISQSGAFIVSRLSALETLDPTITVSVGNQCDATLSDLLRVVGERADIHTVGLYAEGFNSLDGLDLLKVMSALTDAGKCIILYKAGRTPQGRDAAAGHTAAVAGDYDICEAGAEAAGALVAHTLREMQDLLEVASANHDRTVRGRRIGGISNAGFETVGMADSVAGPHEAELPILDALTHRRIAEVLDAQRLSALVNLRNPIDLTPMAGEAAYEGVARALLASDSIDAIVVSCVPPTPALATTASELESRPSLADALARLRAESDKPIVAVVDAGPFYAPFVRSLRAAGLPCLSSADDAVRVLARYLEKRLAHTRPMTSQPVGA
jgi:acyl-CoA synthetase (NDP forming)